MSITNIEAIVDTLRAQRSASVHQAANLDLTPAQRGEQAGVATGLLYAIEIVERFRSPKTLAEQIAADVPVLIHQVDAFLATFDPKRDVRDSSRKAIELHSKLEKAAGEIGKLRRDSADNSLLTAEADQVLDATRRILGDVFKVEATV